MADAVAKVRDDSRLTRIKVLETEGNKFLVLKGKCDKI